MCLNCMGQRGFDPLYFRMDLNKASHCVVVLHAGQFFCRSVYTLTVSVICKKRADDGSTICILSEGKYNTFNMLTCFPKFPLKPKTLKVKML